MNHETRMELAKRLTDYVLRHHPDVIAIAVHGSTAKGEDRGHSDLEMFAVTRGPSQTAAYQVIHVGVVVEIEFLALEDALRQAGRMGWNWPFSADGWIHTVAMHDPEAVLPRLALLAADHGEAAFLQSARHAVISSYEDLCKIRNFLETGEEPLARLMCHGFALYGVARFVALMNRQYFNGIRNLLSKPREFTILPPHFWDDYPRLLAVEGETRDLARRAERLYGECRDILARAGVSIPDDLSFEEKLERGRGVREP